jgi:hypothetical protein
VAHLVAIFFIKALDRKYAFVKVKLVGNYDEILTTSNILKILKSGGK